VYILHKELWEIPRSEAIDGAIGGDHLHGDENFLLPKIVFLQITEE